MSTFDMRCMADLCKGKLHLVVASAKIIYKTEIRFSIFFVPLIYEHCGIKSEPASTH